MTGQRAGSTPAEINFNQDRRELSLKFGEGSEFTLPRK